MPFYFQPRWTQSILGYLPQKRSDMENAFLQTIEQKTRVLKMVTKSHLCSHHLTVTQSCLVSLVALDSTLDRWDDAELLTPPCCCSNKQRNGNVCDVQLTLERYRSTAWKLECLRCAYTHGESANREPDRIPIQLRHFTVAQKKHRDFGMMISCTVLALLLYPGGREKYSYLLVLFLECEIHSENMLCP